jgi:hypothetical protein
MLSFNVKLTRGPRYVTLQMRESRPLVRGAWRLLEDESNARLTCGEGTWENWALGSPHGARDIRLYDPSGTIAAVLKGFPAGTTAAEGIVVRPDFAGSFGDGDFLWSQVPHVSARERDAGSRMAAVARG